MKKDAQHIPTEEEILSYRNVPANVAALFLGWPRNALCTALQDGRAPFGIAVHGKANWTYQISPGALVKYQREGLNTFGLKELQQTMADGIEQILSAKLVALNQVLEAVSGV